MKRLAFAVLVLLAVTLALTATEDARAQPKATVLLEGTPIFGKDAPLGDGWSEFVARVENVSGAPLRGTVEIASGEMSYGRSGGDQAFFTAHASFALAAGASAFVRLPVHSFSAYASSATIRALSEDGKKLAETSVGAAQGSAPLLVEIDQTPRIGIVMRNWPMHAGWNPWGGSYYGGGGAASALATGAATFDRTTGDPILPDHATGYAPVTAVIIPSDVLARLSGAPLEALVDWVLAGGTMAVVVTRPEDLRGAPLTSMLGGPATTAGANPKLFTLPSIERPSSGGGYFDPDNETEGLHGAPGDGFVPIKGTPNQKPPAGGPQQPPAGPHVGPLPALRERLTGYTGGNLRPSDFGATASYGLGEVHLLAFDPTSEPALSDGWTHGRVVDLVQRAWTLRAREAFPQGSGERRTGGAQEIRRELDPNENFRPALGLAAILLVAYSIVSGPLTFIRAMKKGRPLDPLLWVPVWSAAALLVIVFIGLAGKGFRGRARRISIVEAAGGMSRGSIRRFRGFFSSSTQALNVMSTDSTCVLDVASSDQSEHGATALRVDRGGVLLEKLAALPWQTVVVGEDGFAELRGGVTILRTPDGSADVVNRTGAPIEDVIVHVPGASLFYFESIADGAKVHASTGKAIAAAPSTFSYAAGSLTVHRLDLSELAPAREDARKAWTAFGQASGMGVDWFPDDRPVVLATLGGPGVRSDAGLSVDSDHTYLRVVGEGGTP